jgi:hypothetical protein
MLEKSSTLVNTHYIVYHLALLKPKRPTCLSPVPAYEYNFPFGYTIHLSQPLNGAIQGVVHVHNVCCSYGLGGFHVFLPTGIAVGIVLLLLGSMASVVEAFVFQVFIMRGIVTGLVSIGSSSFMHMLDSLSRKKKGSKTDGRLFFSGKHEGRKFLRLDVSLFFLHTTESFLQPNDCVESFHGISETSSTSAKRRTRDIYPCARVKPPPTVFMFQAGR